MAKVNLNGITCVVCDCITCGIPFTVPLTVYEQHRTRGGYHHCPNGHSQGWSKDRSEEADIRRERDRLKQQVAYHEERVRIEREERQAAERRASAARGQVTRLKNRAAAGVCPCCNRTFTNLARHMAGQHPTFKAEAVDGDNIVPLRATP